MARTRSAPRDDDHGRAAIQPGAPTGSWTRGYRELPARPRHCRAPAGPSFDAPAGAPTNRPRHLARWFASDQGSPKSSHLGSSKIPHPGFSPRSRWGGTRPGLSLSLSRYELPRMLTIGTQTEIG